MSLSKAPGIMSTLFCIISGVLCQQQFNVKYSSTSICGLKRSFVDIPCTYSYPSNLKVRQKFWHIYGWLWVPEDLSLDSKYQGRVEYLGDDMNNCTLRLKDVKESDTEASYRFRMITDPKETFSGSAVSLSLTDLHVTLSPESVSVGDKVTLTCSTTCSLSNNPTYIWYRNSQPLSDSHTTSSNTLTITSLGKENTGYYSCAVRGHEDHPSPSMSVPNSWSVSYTPQSFCALKGSSVQLHSYYTYPYGQTVMKALWFITWTLGQEPDGLMADERYLGRVNYEDNENNHTLSIRNLTIRDSNKYRFRFITDTDKTAGGKVELSVTELQVLMDPVTVGEGSKVTLTCSTNCSLSNNPTYIWYRNSQFLSNPHITSSNTLTITSVSKEDSGQYQCAVRGHEDHPSPSVCVLSCWSVTYTPQSICALKGSSVELHSYYSYPEDHTVTEKFWFTTWLSDQEPEDLMQYERYQRRAIYTDHTKNDHTLFIGNLTTRDPNLYRFRFVTDKKYRYAGGTVKLSVTDLQLLVDPTTVMEGNNVTLTCNTTCSLSNNPTYIWYRNSQPVENLRPHDNRLVIDSARPEDAGKYSCAVQGHKTHSSPEKTIDVQYGPRNITTSVHPFGESVSLTCCSDANPPAHIYMWYQKIGSESFHVGLGQILSIARINSGEKEYYFCVAQNEIGQNRSSAVQIYVAPGLKTYSFWIILVGGMIATLVSGFLIGVMVYKRLTKAREVNDISTGVVGGTKAESQAVQLHPADGTYMGLNLNIITSPIYDTLDNVKISADHTTDVYSNPASVHQNVEENKMINRRICKGSDQMGKRDLAS